MLDYWSVTAIKNSNTDNIDSYKNTRQPSEDFSSLSWVKRYGYGTDLRPKTLSKLYLIRGIKPINNPYWLPVRSTCSRRLGIIRATKKTDYCLGTVLDSSRLNDGSIIPEFSFVMWLLMNTRQQEIVKVLSASDGNLTRLSIPRWMHLHPVIIDSVRMSLL